QAIGAERAVCCIVILPHLRAERRNPTRDRLVHVVIEIDCYGVVVLVELEELIVLEPMLLPRRRRGWQRRSAAAGPGASARSRAPCSGGPPSRAACSGATTSRATTSAATARPA